MPTIPESNLDIKGKYKKGHHPNSLKNLKSGYYGQDHSNNGFSLTQALKQRIGKDTALRNEIVESTLQGCILREPAPFHEVWDRVEGKLQDTTPPRDINVVFVIGEGYKNVAPTIEGEALELLPSEGEK